MNSLKNSSELKEAATLIGDLLLPIPESLQYDVFHDICPPGAFQDFSESTHLFDEFTEAQSLAQSSVGLQKPASPLPLVDADFGEIEYVGDQLETLLTNLCHQSGFQSAIVADNQGLPIGGYNTPTSIDSLAAFSSVMGSVIDRVPYFFDQSDANNVSIDINFMDKAVVRKFQIDDSPFFLLILCPQEIDERAYIELFSDQIVEVLRR